MYAVQAPEAHSSDHKEEGKAMIMALHFRGKLRFLEDPKDVSVSLGDVFAVDQGLGTDVKASWLAMSSEEGQYPMSMLEVSANLRNGLAGAVWFAGVGRKCAVQKAPSRQPGRSPMDFRQLESAEFLTQKYFQMLIAPRTSILAECCP
ncbi:hypothetical protein [Streptomyces sp. NPDC059743]|uniref:hypothetical protein n=1 Tax=Streptomyces sp. NPDC059743 TaxID=3346928 RepID=UPI003654347F